MMNEMMHAVRLSSINYLCLDGFDDRYQQYSETNNANTDRYYLIGMNLQNAQDIAPDMIVQLLKLIDFIGQSRVYVAIFENGSSDHTKTYLRLLDVILAHKQVARNILLDVLVRPAGIHRIEYLAGVRNRIVDLMLTHVEAKSLADKLHQVIMLNDIFFCAQDILELMYQFDRQGADMTCGLDFDRDENGIGFYDTWVARDVDGRPFNKRPLDAFVQHEQSAAKLKQKSPFQVYCCWDGMVVLNPKVFVESNIRFRREHSVIKQPEGPQLQSEGKLDIFAFLMQQPTYEKCSGSEMTQFCRDLASSGYHRRIIVPTVRVAYDLQIFTELCPYTETHSAEEDELVEYVGEPKSQFCHPMDADEGDGGFRTPEGMPGEEILNFE